MKSSYRPLLLALALALSWPALASEDDRPDHYKGEQADTLAQAYENLARYNRKLATLLDGELTPQTMAEIHQITYSLENALQRIKHEVSAVADTLEALHIASEQGNHVVAREKGRSYLEGAGKIIRD